jgi:hypothetical protein
MPTNLLSPAFVCLFACLTLSAFVSLPAWLPLGLIFTALLLLLAYLPLSAWPHACLLASFCLPTCLCLRTYLTACLCLPACFSLPLTACQSVFACLPARLSLLACLPAFAYFCLLTCLCLTACHYLLPLPAACWPLHDCVCLPAPVRFPLLSFDSIPAFAGMLEFAYLCLAAGLPAYLSACLFLLPASVCLPLPTRSCVLACLPLLSFDCLPA